MDHTGHAKRFHVQCLHVLRKLCSRTGFLPTSCVLTEGLTRTSTESIMSGGFADIWRGKLKGKHVALKVLRIHGSRNLQKVKKVCSCIGSDSVHLWDQWSVVFL